MQSLRKLHEKDVAGVLKQLKAYHHKAQGKLQSKLENVLISSALNAEGIKLAHDLIDISSKCRDDNEWGTAIRVIVG